MRPLRPSLLPSRRILAAVAVVWLSGCGGSPASSDVPSPAPAHDYKQEPKGLATRFYAQNVAYRIDEAVVVDMASMDADLVPYDLNKPLMPSNIRDYLVKVHLAEFSMTDEALAALMNRHVFNFPGSPISDIRISCINGRLRQTAKLRKFGLTITTELEGNLTPNGKGQLVLRPDRIKSNGIPVKGVLDLFGVEVAEMLKAREDKGVRIDGNDIILFPDRMIPPPAMRGHCIGATIQQGRVTMRFDDGVRRERPALPEPARNWILMWGGNVLTNNNLVFDARIQLIDDTPENPMFYYQPLYLQQLETGLTVSTPRGEMITYLPDVMGTTIERPRYRPPLPLPTR
ncbi:MAG: hypothetical protein VKO21_00325 [Candidatus Sericytochromatia bacterium]|nr:hypothetical protein [Candidatus Sericytochromatia bacterium]